MKGSESKIWQQLGLGSYRGRYLWLTVSLSIALLVIALTAQEAVRRNTGETTQQTSLYASAISDVTEAGHRLHVLREALVIFALDPEELGQDRIQTITADMQDSLARLANESDAGVPGYQGTVALLVAESRDLGRWVDEMIKLRLDPKLWIPANRTLQEQLLPQAEIVASSLQAIDQLLGNAEGAESLRLQAAGLHIRWLHVISEMRLMLANRFGTFPMDNKNPMRDRAQDLEIHLQQFHQDLSDMTRSVGEQNLVFVLDRLVLLREAVSEWSRAYQRLRVLISRQGWRQDLLLLNTQIDPLTQRMAQRLNSLRLQLQDGTQGQLMLLAGQAESLASSIGWLSAALAGLFALGYLAFQRWLLKPIEHISEQLLREGRGGEEAVSTRLPAVKETRQLVQSFSEMHAQVRARERRLDYMAYHDPLTGLPNRVLFHERLDDALHNELPRGHDVGVLFLDLDRFKQINDTHGHLVGDKFLIEVAHRLRRTFRSEDLVARLSGDEFAILLQRFGQIHEMSFLAKKAIDALAEPYQIDGASFRSSASVGMSVAPLHGSTAERLIQQADTAMYHAKASGRSKFAEFSSEMLEQSAAQLALENDLHKAFIEKEFQLFAQPVVDCQSLRPYAQECLIRWRHPEKGLLMPIDFLKTLEEMGLMRDLTDWILDQLEQTRATIDMAYTINLSALQLNDAGFLSHLQERIRSGEIQARNLIIEITEDTLSDDLDRITLQLSDLQAIGVRIALDDFGTGQASLSHLRAFPFDTVKIDRSFVRDIAEDHQDADLIRAIIRLAHTLGIEVVAEGVETREQHAFLRAEGCDLVQGFLLGRPAPMPKDRGKILAFSS